jgi:hypothetical protein
MLFSSTRGLPSAVRVLKPGDEPQGLDIYGVDTSLDTQLRTITALGKPDAYLFTADSAIPVADAIRGYYQELGDITPLTDYIEADRGVSYHSGDYPWLTDEKEKELRRLSKCIKGMSHVCIVEQFVQRGITMQYAANLVHEAAGPDIISGIQGRWYIDAHDVDKTNLTSPHKTRMQVIGASAAVSSVPVNT